MSLRDHWKYSAANTRLWNWRGGKARERGRRDVVQRAGDRVRSRTPVVRSQINRGTGRPHADDLVMGRLSDQSLARWKAAREAQAARARHNQQAVRDTLARRDPQFSRAVDRVTREMTQGRGRSR